MQSIKKVLVVDDQADDRHLIAKILKKLGFIVLFEAEDGAEAIKIALEQKPDLILMDIHMPGVDGYEACRVIKSEPQLSSTIVVFMTAVNNEEIDDKIIEVKADDLLRKPLDASEVYFRIINYLSSNKNMHEPQNDPFSGEQNIDLGHGFFYQTHLKQICIGDKVISLMNQEIALLEILIRYKNQVVPYALLVNAISVDGTSTIGNVRTLVKLLRHKTYNTLISNLHSYGYSLGV